MRFLLTLLVCTLVLGVAAQEPPEPAKAPPRLTIAAAASVAPAIGEVAAAWAASNNAEVVLVPGATHLLARQIRNGAPFDLFVSSDMESIQALEAEGHVAEGSAVEWGRGALVVWQDVSARVPLAVWSDIARPEVRRIGVPNPEAAPYGRAAMEALSCAGIAESVEERLVFGSDSRQPLQWARSGNVDAAFVAASVAAEAGGRTLPVPGTLHAPIRHGLCVVAKSRQAQMAKALADHIAEAPESRAVLTRHGVAPVPEESP